MMLAVNQWQIRQLWKSVASVEHGRIRSLGGTCSWSWKICESCEFRTKSETYGKFSEKMIFADKILDNLKYNYFICHFTAYQLYGKGGCHLVCLSALF